MSIEEMIEKLIDKRCSDIVLLVQNNALDELRAYVTDVENLDILDEDTIIAIYEDEFGAQPNAEPKIINLYEELKKSVDTTHNN